MLGYQLKLAARSVRRNPLLTLLLVSGIGLGIGVSMVFVNAYYRFSGDPIPDKSDKLFYVQMDSWNPERPFDSDDPSEPPNQMTFMDAMAVMASDIPTLRTANYKVDLTVYPPKEGARPFRETVRLCYADFFPMFEVPFLHGNGWTREADEAREPVVVLSREANRELFGGGDTVGRKLTIEGRDFTVIGILDDWRPMPKYYDTMNDDLGAPERMFMPFHFGEEFEVYTSGNDSGWKGRDPGYDGWLKSESVWIQTWVQLDNASQKDAFVSFMNAYAMEQKKAGRFQRPVNNRLRNVMQWLEHEQVVPPAAKTLLLISLLFLLVCSVNLIGVLLGKFIGRAPEVGVRRALGASRKAIFVQHVLECELIGIVGGLAGLGLSTVGMKLVDSLFDQNFNFGLDWNLFAVAVALSLASALVAGLYPAWRICRIPPGLHLKLQ